LLLISHRFLDEQVVSVKLFGVTFSNTLRFDEHVKNILTIYKTTMLLVEMS